MAQLPSGIFSILVTEVIDGLVYFGVNPLLPMHLKENHGLTALDITCVSAVYSLVQGACLIPLGSLSDSFGRKPVLLACVTCSSALYLGMPACQNYWALLLAQGLLGASRGTDPVVIAYIMDLTTAGTGAKSLALRASVQSLSGMLGAAFGASLFENYGWGCLSRSMATLGGLQVLLGFMLWTAPETSANNVHSPMAMAKSDSSSSFGSDLSEEEWSPVTAIVRHFKDKNTGPLLLFAIVGSLLASMTASCLPFILGDKYKYGPSDFSRFTALTSLLAFTAAQFSDWQIKKIGEAGTLVVAKVISMVCACWFLLDAPWAAWVMMLTTVCTVLEGIALNALLERLTPEALRGEVFGLFGAVTAICYALGAPLGGALYEYSWRLPFALPAVLSVVSISLVRSQLVGTVDDLPKVPERRRASASLGMRRLSNAGACGADPLLSLVRLNQVLTKDLHFDEDMKKVYKEHKSRTFGRHNSVHSDSPIADSLRSQSFKGDFFATHSLSRRKAHPSKAQ